MVGNEYTFARFDHEDEYEQSSITQRILRLCQLNSKNI